MRIYLRETQRVPVRGGTRIYKAPAYFNAPQELAEKWIGLDLAVEATEDNTHVEPESWAPARRPGPRPVQLEGSKPEKPSPPGRKAKPKPLEGPKAPKGETPKRKAKPVPLKRTPQKITGGTGSDDLVTRMRKYTGLGEYRTTYKKKSSE